MKWNGGDVMDKDDEFGSTIAWIVSVVIVVAGFALLVSK